jgi:hypothetical protein
VEGIGLLHQVEAFHPEQPLELTQERDRTLAIRTSFGLH